ncbi:MAG TPA: prephenate dehydratase domain-containing protein [Chitinophagales bacterium]|mgnify:CR=1 FL=1|nr:prephenate dehydratase domain-containing protein [Chitinophagales bacterium]HRX24490.1 prephenate dehydratase domain-containing protein [Chitinophagales bacterium]
MSRLFYLGPEGSFHHEMALSLSEYNSEVIASSDAEQVCKLVASDIQAYGLLAIENKLAGAVNTHLRYMLESGCHIKGQYWLPVHHHLLALPGINMEDIEVVSSHPMAFNQSRRFLSDKPWKLRETSSTSAAARELLDGAPGAAAIASKAAMKTYGLNCIRNNVEDPGDNATRFVLLQSSQKNDTDTTDLHEMASFYTPASAIPHMLAEAGSLSVRLVHRWDVPQHDLIYTEWIAETSWPEDLTHTFISRQAVFAGKYGHAEIGNIN